MPALSSRLIPETKGRSLEEMDVIFGSVTADQRQKHIQQEERGEITALFLCFGVNSDHVTRSSPRARPQRHDIRQVHWCKGLSLPIGSPVFLILSLYLGCPDLGRAVSLSACRACLDTIPSSMIMIPSRRPFSRSNAFYACSVRSAASFVLLAQ